MHAQAGYGTLIGRIRENIRALIRKQIELPKQEIREILQANLRAVKWFAVAAAFGVMALIGIVILLVAIAGGLLSLLLPYPWALVVGALIVLVLLGAGAAFTGWTGYKALELRGPERSIASFKETVDWAKARLTGQTGS